MVILFLFFSFLLRVFLCVFLLLLTVNSVIYAGKIFMLIHHFEPNFILLNNIYAN